MRGRVWARRMLRLGVAYALVYRPWQLSWGATAREVTERLPGDEIVTRAQWQATRAVDIDADPEIVWPWLVQIGAYPRAGWYSYDWVDNGRIPSATSIRPELQALAVGDWLPMTPGSSAAFVVEAIDPARSLVMANRERGGVVTATFVLRRRPPHGCRLLQRIRFRVDASGLAWAAAMDAGDFVMSRRMLLGIARRAERMARRTRGGPEPGDHAPDRPLTFDLSVAIRRPPATTYAALADVQDLEPIPRTAGVRMRKSPLGPTRVGTRWHEQVRMAPGLWMRIESTVTDARPPDLLGMDFTGAWFTGHLAYEIEVTPDGSVLHQRETLRLKRPFTFLSRQVDARLRTRLLDRLADLRDVIETQPA